VGIATQAPLAADSTSPTAITITTYGLDDDAFAAVRDEWAERWSAVTDAKVTTDTGEAPATGHAPYTAAPTQLHTPTSTPHA
jgi:hypothetical protein